MNEWMNEWNLNYSTKTIISTCDIQHFGEWTSDSAPGERIADSAASEHNQTQGGALSGTGRLAGEKKAENPRAF